MATFNVPEAAPVALPSRRSNIEVQTPLGQLKRKPYNPAEGARPSLQIALQGAIRDIPVHKQWVTGAAKERQAILKNLQNMIKMPDPSQWGSNIQTTGGRLGGGKLPGGNFGSLVAAIRGKESGGNYRAVNPHSGAMGAYQIMPANLAPWSKEALGRVVSRSEFMSNPRIQDAIAQYKLGQYYRQYGAAGAATAWYAGPRAVRSKMGSTRNQGGYPSINAYWKDILGRM